MSRPIRQDPVAGKRMRKAVFWFAAAMFGVFAAIAWSILTAEGGEAKDGPALAICLMVLVVFAASVYVFVAYGKLCLWYRCPQCRARIPRPPKIKVGDPIRYVCAACDIEWETGWNVAPRDVMWD